MKKMPCNRGIFLIKILPFDVDKECARIAETPKGVVMNGMFQGIRIE